MILFLLGAIFITGILNMAFYEYRVLKGVGNPKTFDFTGYRGKI